MDWDFREDAPIYSQLIEGFKLSIASGELKPGEKLRSVRELAAWAGVNPNTMQRALGELEREGLVFAQRTSGRYVTEAEGAVEAVRRELARSRIAEFTAYMSKLGYSAGDIVKFITEGEKTSG